jgi:aryl-phospho-beta-D-glucosidase BglC (GH1 family)
MGDADDYTGLDKSDSKFLKSLLKIFQEEDMPVIITMTSLPGSRWKQNNGGRDDLRIWQDENYQKQAAKFWKDFALELRNDTIVVGYKILNEPHPEKILRFARR